MAILRNGFAIRHERREALDTVTRLYLVRAADNTLTYLLLRSRVSKKCTHLLPPTVSSAPADDLEAVVSAASKRNNIDPDLVNSLILAESGFDPKAVSRKGAQG